MIRIQNLNNGNIVRILKHKTIFAKVYVPNWREDVSKSWIYVISDLKGEEIIGTFYEKELQTNPKEFRVEKVIKVIKVIKDKGR